MSVPETQTAVVQSDYGLPKDVLTVHTGHPVTAPSAHQVQVRVLAASINTVDDKSLRGNMKMFDKYKCPHTPGRDFAGIVTAVGSAVTRLHVGDAVYGDSNDEQGAYAQYACVHEKFVSLKPKALSFPEAAAFPLAAMTALGALEKAEVRDGTKVVIVGASGGVGHFAVQIAKILGASSVVGVCSGKNADFVKSLGADAVVDRTTTKVGEAVEAKDADVVFDCVGGKEQWEEAQKALKKGGTFVTIVGDDQENKVSPGALVSMAGAVAGRKLSGLFGAKHSYYMHLLTPSHALLDRLSSWLVEGKPLKPTIGNTFNLTEAGVWGMYEAMEGRKATGKIVLEVAKEGDVPAQPTTTSTSSSSSSSSSSEATEKPVEAPAEAKTDVTTGSIEPATTVPPATTEPAATTTAAAAADDSVKDTPAE